MPPVLRYIPRSRRKEGESPFSECTIKSVETEATKKDDGATVVTLKESALVLTLKMWQAKVSRPPLSGFVVSSEEGDDLPSARTREGFDPNAYKLMEKAGYDFQNPAALGKVVKAKPHGLTETQWKIQKQGGSVAVSKVGLGFTPPQLVRISGR